MSIVTPSDDPVRGPFAPRAAAVEPPLVAKPLTVRIGGRTLRWSPELADRFEEPDGSGDDPTVPLAELLVELAGLDEAARARLLAEAVERCAGDPSASEDLRRLRDVLRSTHLPVEVRARQTRSASIEVFARLDDRSWYLRGWIGAEDGELTALTLVSPVGERIELSGSACRYPRPDVDSFLGVDARRGASGCGRAVVGTGRFPAVDGDWLVELAFADGEVRELRCPDALTSPLEVRRLLLGELALDRPGDDRILDAVLHDALQRTERTRVRHVAVDVVDTHGDVSEHPDVSVVVPLYGRLDFCEHQLAQFVHDPTFAGPDSSVELIYVLDQPEHADGFRAQAKRLFRLYGVPMRVVTLTENAGFSGANNLGAAVASGRLLLLCNSDVLPIGTGWLERLVDFHDATPAVGAVAPRLVFEDGSLQHAGMYFDRPAGEPLWSNEHYFKGLSASFPPAGVSRSVPAVTAACLLTARGLFAELGGLSGQYLQGDYEDSDYCLRLRASGRDCWYVAEVTLLHLEGMSYGGELRSSVARYNQWLHTRTWDRSIAALMSERSSSPAVVAGSLHG